MVERTTIGSAGSWQACSVGLFCRDWRLPTPAVLEIGNRKQLFLDRHVVESLTHAKRVLNQAVKHNHGSGRPQVRVELLGVSHEPLEGFLLRESDPAGTSGRHVMTWQGRIDVSRLAGQVVRLRFSMKNAKLYSFQFR